MGQVTDEAHGRLVDGLVRALEFGGDNEVAEMSNEMKKMVGRQFLENLDEGEAVEWAVAGISQSNGTTFDASLLGITPTRVLFSGKSVKFFGKGVQKNLAFDRTTTHAEITQGRIGRSDQLTLLTVQNGSDAVTIGLMPSPRAHELADMTRHIITGSTQ